MEIMGYDKIPADALGRQLWQRVLKQNYGATDSGSARAGVLLFLGWQVMDTITKEERSEIMGRVHSKDTHPEMVVRRLVHSLGYRYRLHKKDLPGKPDMKTLLGRAGRLPA